MENFDAVQQVMAAGVHRPTRLEGHRTGRGYALSGVVLCTCHPTPRRMEGTWAKGVTRYRATRRSTRW